MMRIKEIVFGAPDGRSRACRYLFCFLVSFCSVLDIRAENDDLRKRFWRYEIRLQSSGLNTTTSIIDTQTNAVIFRTQRHLLTTWEEIAEALDKDPEARDQGLFLEFAGLKIIIDKSNSHILKVPQNSEEFEDFMFFSVTIPDHGWNSDIKLAVAYFFFDTFGKTYFFLFDQSSIEFKGAWFEIDFSPVLDTSQLLSQSEEVKSKTYDEFIRNPAWTRFYMIFSSLSRDFIKGKFRAEKFAQLISPEFRVRASSGGLDHLESITDSPYIENSPFQKSKAPAKRAAHDSKNKFTYLINPGGNRVRVKAQRLQGNKDFSYTILHPHKKTPSAEAIARLLQNSLWISFPGEDPRVFRLIAERATFDGEILLRMQSAPPNSLDPKGRAFSIYRQLHPEIRAIEMSDALYMALRSGEIAPEDGANLKELLNGAPAMDCAQKLKTVTEILGRQI